MLTPFLRRWSSGITARSAQRASRGRLARSGTSAALWGQAPGPTARTDRRGNWSEHRRKALLERRRRQREKPFEQNVNGFGKFDRGEQPRHRRADPAKQERLRVALLCMARGNVRRLADALNVEEVRFVWVFAVGGVRRGGWIRGSRLPSKRLLEPRRGAFAQTFKTCHRERTFPYFRSGPFSLIQVQ